MYYSLGVIAIPSEYFRTLADWLDCSKHNMARTVDKGSILLVFAIRSIGITSSATILLIRRVQYTYKPPLFADVEHVITGLFFGFGLKERVGGGGVGGIIRKYRVNPLCTCLSVSRRPRYSRI